jgi:predicted DNA repair protein MutK
MHLIDKQGESKWVRFQHWFGEWILRFAPKFMKTLSVVGTAAMFLVGGGILVHSIPAVADTLHHVEVLVRELQVASGFTTALAAMLFNGLFGLLVGGLLVGVESGIKRVLPAKST